MLNHMSLYTVISHSEIVAINVKPFTASIKISCSFDVHIASRLNDDLLKVLRDVELC